MKASMGKIRLSILGRCRLFREVLAAWLKAEEGLELIASADSLHGLLGDSQARTTHVLLVHAGEAPASAWQTVTDAEALLPAAWIVVLASDQDLTGAAGYIEAGAVACVEQSAPYSELVETIREASKGQSAGSLRMVACVMRRIVELAACRPTGDEPPPQRLSDREAEVAGLVSRGMANKQIAQRLHITTHTVKTHVHNVLQKLQMRRRREVMRRGQWVESV